MKARFASLALLATSALVSAAAMAAPVQPANGAKPMFGVIPANAPWHAATVKAEKNRKPGATITQWNGGFTDLTGRAISFTMIGTDPGHTNTNSTIPIEIVPTVFKYSAFGNETFDPSVDKYSDGETVLDNFVNSPLLGSPLKFKSGGQALGKTQYIDAFQRGNFWGKKVKRHTNYHVLLGSPTVLSPLKITVSSGQGVVEKNPFGSQDVGTYGFFQMDQQINSYISAHSEVTPDQFVFFISHNIFLTSGGCCIGGYHTATASQPGGQTYGYTTLVTEAGSFSQDVSAASHEIGEWMDDPFTNNHVNCNDNSILEDGDPLETRPNFGAFPYVAHGFTYNLQDLVYVGYFGAPRRTSVKQLLSFNQLEQNVCPGQ